MLEFDGLFPTIEELVMLHFLSGAESEINQRSRIVETVVGQGKALSDIGKSHYQSPYRN